MRPDPRAPGLVSTLADAAEALDRGRRGPGVEVQMLRTHGWLCAALPPAFGGQGWGIDAAGASDGFAALFHLASVSLPATRLFEGHVNAVRLIDRHGTQAQRERFFSDVRDGALLAIWGAQGDRPARIAGEDHGLVLHGTKTFASGLGEVDYAIVTASDAHDRCQMVIVPARETHRLHGEAWDVAAMVGTCSGDFTLDHLAAGQEWQLGPPGALFVEPDFNGGVWRLCAGYAGAMTAVAEHALRLCEERGLDQDPVTRQRLGQIAMHAQTALLWAWQACCALEMRTDLSPPGEGAVATSLFAREAIEAQAAAQIQLVERIGGTALHRRGSPLGRLLRDLRFFLRQAALDAKLDYALTIWRERPRLMLDAVLGPGPVLPGC